MTFLSLVTVFEKGKGARGFSGGSVVKNLRDDARHSSSIPYPGRSHVPDAAGFSSYNGDLNLPLGFALGSPIFPSSCEGKLGVALESLQGPRDLT